MKGSENLVIPTGGEVVGVTLTVAKVGSGLSKVLASKRASNLLNLSDHFWSNYSILPSAEDLWNLGVGDLTGFSELDLECFEDWLLDLSVGLGFFFLEPELEPGDCTIPWLSTAPTIITEDGSMRE